MSNDHINLIRAFLSGFFSDKEFEPIDKRLTDTLYENLFEFLYENNIFVDDYLSKYHDPIIPNVDVRIEIEIDDVPQINVIIRDAKFEVKLQ